MIERHTRGIVAVAGFCMAASVLYAQTPTPLQIVTDALPSASAGIPYSQQLVTTLGLCSSVGSPSSKIESGALPPGVYINSPAATKVWSLEGTPSATGSFTFAVHIFWTHIRVGPFDHDCVEDATKTFTLAVQASQTLVADRQQITAVWHTGSSAPSSDTVVVSTAGAALAITVQSVIDSGGPWLSVSAQSAGTPAVLSIGYSVGGLTPGTYTGRVIVTAAGAPALTIPVTLVVIADTNIQFQAVPPLLAFSSVAGGPDPPAQSLRVTVTGANVLYQASVTSAPPNGKWLAITPTNALTPSVLAVSVSAKDLDVGVYRGVITVAVGGVPGSSLSIPVTFTSQPSTQRPTILAGGVVNAAGLGSGIAPGTWVSIFGTSLAGTTRQWRDADFVNGKLPTALDGVSVTINGKPAAVYFVSPLQLNVLAADDSATGLVPLQVTTVAGASDSVLALEQTTAPAFFQVRSANVNYAAGTHADGSSLVGTAAKAGETIVLYGTGFGATDPSIPATSLVSSPLPLARPGDLRIRIGGLDAAIGYAGLISPGVYQFNVVVPQVAAGDQLVVGELRGLLTQANLLVNVQ
jgi:uncharacterized protein (TIGR03437 family)